MSKSISIDLIYPNPDQPRKNFHDGKLQELANSIKQQGLLQPIRVISDFNGKYMIVLGERRYKACQLLNWKSMKCEVVRIDSHAVEIQALIENLQRTDLTPIEEAQGFQAILDKGYTVAELAKQLGIKQSWRITERTSLLNLRDKYQRLVGLSEKSGLGNSQAFEMSRLPSEKQDVLYELIVEGKANSYNKLRAFANELLEPSIKVQLNVTGAAQDEKENALLIKMTHFDQQLDKVVALVKSGYSKDAVNVATKIGPNRLNATLDKVKLIKTHLLQLEKELEKAAIVAEVAQCPTEKLEKAVVVAEVAEKAVAVLKKATSLEKAASVVEVTQVKPELEKTTGGLVTHRKSGPTIFTQ